MTGAVGRVSEGSVADAAELPDEVEMPDEVDAGEMPDEADASDAAEVPDAANVAEGSAAADDGARVPGSAPATPAPTPPAPSTPAPAPPRRTRRTRQAAAADPAAGPAVAATSGRPSGLRLAGLLLRMGQLPLARAQLEALAGRGELDDAALLDLAEVRWRTGDLAGAGEAAGALLVNGREDGLALLIAAESVAAIGRPGEARRLASRALAAAPGPLDPIFAGMPRSPVWPDDPELTGDGGAAPVNGAASGHPEHLAHVPHQRHAAPVNEQAGPASAAAAEAFAGGRAALAGGDTGLAALRLGVAMRLDAGFAAGVLEAVGAWDRDPALALVAGDALRLLGRESEALVAFDLARGHP
jgi:hypothetical protein